MAAGRKRFTVSVSREMEAELDAAKQGRYDSCSQNRMLQDLIRRGLKSRRIDASHPGQAEKTGK